MQKKFQEILHRYKVEVFHREHDKSSAAEFTKHCLHVTEDVLQQKYHFHFHKLPDANRAEIINMINNYVREAILPPVIEKLVERQLRLEQRLEAMLNLNREILEALSEDRATSGAKH